MPNAFALTINFATGQDSSGNVQQGGGLLDANWTGSKANQPFKGSNTYTVAPSNPDWYSGWFANDSSSSWIAPNPFNSYANGSFVLTYTFNLDGYDLNSAVFKNLKWAIDDNGYVALNGKTQSSLSAGAWGRYTAFTMDPSHLQPGVNTLTIVSTYTDSYLEGARMTGSLEIDIAVALKAINAGAQHACAVLEDGALKCWGDNQYGQATPPAGAFKAVGASRANVPQGHPGHSCALRDDNTLACWGDNAKGQATPPEGTFKALAVGVQDACAIKADGALACWGQQAVPPPPGLFKAVSAGGYFMCGIQSNNALACWGSSRYGQTTPPPGSFKAVSGGFRHACALKSDNTLACWGDNRYGQAIPPAGTFKAVSAGLWHTCAIRDDDTLACWGLNGSGQATPPQGAFKGVAAGLFYSCALFMDGGLSCWGKPPADLPR